MSKKDKALSYIPVVNKKLFRVEKPGVSSDCEVAAAGVDEAVDLVEDWMEALGSDGQEDVMPSEFESFDDIDKGTDFSDEEVA
jgi:hypothetical protein